MKEALQKIKFHYLVDPFYFPERNQLKAFLLEQLATEGRSVEAINYIFCTDSYLLEVNKEYLQHDTLTDIITFELSEKDRPLLSDIYISVERVRENANDFHQTFLHELRRVIFHGALHLAGYKDKTKVDTDRMRLKEEEWLEAYRVSRGTVSR